MSLSTEDGNLEEKVFILPRSARKIFGTCLMLVVFDKEFTSNLKVETNNPERKCKSAAICLNKRNCLRVTKHYSPGTEMTNLELK